MRTAWREGTGGFGGVQEWTKEIRREEGCFVRNWCRERWTRAEKEEPERKFQRGGSQKSGLVGRLDRKEGMIRAHSRRRWRKEGGGEEVGGVKVGSGDWAEEE